MSTAQEPAYDYVVVGSGAGGGTVAARLVEEGFSVLVIEAGPDPLSLTKGRADDDYQVPVFHGQASENPDIAWNHYVSHFDDPAEAAKDSKKTGVGILYPRAGALGGCTAHNAMIFLPPPDSDWDELAAQTGDEGWSAKNMSAHRKKVEQCRHRPFQRLLYWFGLNPSGHGFSGWLPVQRAMPWKAFKDIWLVRMIVDAAVTDLRKDSAWWTRLKAFCNNWGDPNDATGGGGEQLCYLPLATRNHSRTGTRERLVEVGELFPDRLHVMTDTLATEILFDDADNANGIAWRKGRHLYRACPSPSDHAGEAGRSFVSREVILAGGAFATPQLLKLSGIGDPAELEQQGIKVRANLPEVGLNLQDRYEIAVVHKMARPWASMKGARFAIGDPQHRKWQKYRSGMYTSNGTAMAALRRSRGNTGSPDLMMMSLLGRFKGYYPGYADASWPGLDGFSWAILKGWTGNNAGSVTLASRDPRDPPVIAFRNFEQGGESDLDALVEGVEMVRSFCARPKKSGAIAEEETPGANVTGDALKDWVRSNAWGHHACGTAAIGEVLDSRGRVHGVSGLRVVDASIFPRIPGLFIVAAIYLAAEKLAADIVADAEKEK